MQTLVIDTSYGSTVGMVGHDPIVETDSRTHVEKLQVNIATTVEQAGLKPENIDRIIVGIGPAPFTGLRAGIVAGGLDAEYNWFAHCCSVCCFAYCSVWLFCFIVPLPRSRRSSA